MGCRIGALFPSRPTVPDSESCGRSYGHSTEYSKSSRFTASVFHPVAPIVGENVTKLGLIEGSIADLEILHFLRHFGLRQSSGVAIGKFSFRRLLINTFSYQLGCDILDKN